MFRAYNDSRCGKLLLMFRHILTLLAIGLSIAAAQSVDSQKIDATVEKSMKICGVPGAAGMGASRPRARTAPEHAAGGDAVAGLRSSKLLLAVLPAVLAGAAWAYMGGVYSAMWVLYVTELGGSPLVAGLSVSVYSLPIILFSGAAGRPGDRFGIRKMVFLTLLFGGISALPYGFTRNIPFVMALSFVEALGTLVGMPSV